jgi:hypothetical protein
VIKIGNDAAGRAQDLYKAMRRYKHARKRCETCPNLEDCAGIREIETAISWALQVIQDEWSALYDS